MALFQGLPQAIGAAFNLYDQGQQQQINKLHFDQNMAFQKAVQDRLAAQAALEQKNKEDLATFNHIKDAEAQIKENRGEQFAKYPDAAELAPAEFENAKRAWDIKAQGMYDPRDPRFKAPALNDLQPGMAGPPAPDTAKSRADDLSSGLYLLGKKIGEGKIEAEDRKAANKVAEKRAGMAEPLSDAALRAEVEFSHSSGDLSGALKQRTQADNAVRVNNLWAQTYPNDDRSKALATFKANSKSLTTNTTKMDAVEPQVDQLKANLEAYRASVRKIPGFGSPKFNDMIRNSADTVKGDPAMSEYNIYHEAVTVELARVMSGATGSAPPTDAAMAQARKLFPYGASLQQAERAAATAEQEATSRVTTGRAGVEKIRKRIGTQDTTQAPAGDVPTAVRNALPPGLKIKSIKRIR
jgi:uncharacterized protein YcbK (DUF882 family)